MESNISFGQRASDFIADFVGSWRFVLLFLAALIGWIFINSGFVIKTPFDPYPFILLNLFLSTLAAIQAPVIMMSQKRKEERDTARSEEDLAIDTTSELEIRELHAKLDLILKSLEK